MPEVDYKFICDLDVFLMSYVSTSSKRKLKRNYINKLHKRFRTALNKAHKEGYIGKNPYTNFTLKYENSNIRKHSIVEELERIKNASFDDNISLQNIRNIFLFSVYTGLRFSDAINLKCSVEFPAKKEIKLSN